MKDEIEKAQQERANLLAKERGDKALRLIEELTPYIQEIEDDFLNGLLDVDFDKPESVAAHHEQVRKMQNLNSLQDKIAERITAGKSAEIRLNRNPR